MTENTKPTRKCACGRDLNWVWIDGQWLSVYSIWDEGSDFGSLSHASCCKQCSEKEHRRMSDELGY